MDRVQLEKDYRDWGRLYLRLQKKVAIFVEEVADGHTDIDIEKIDQRNGIKALEKILVNNEDVEKYKENPGYGSLFDVKDIAGVRITLNTEHDLLAFATSLENEAKRKFVAVHRDGHGAYSSEGSGTSPQKRSSPFYDAVHLTVTDGCRLGDVERELHCEIQMRTVLGDAWAVQDRKYLYEKTVRGESQELSEAISQIHRGCEKVWSLVKKRSKAE